MPIQPLRLWPGIVIVALQWLVQFVGPKVIPDFTLYAILVGAGGGLLATLIWWLLFSRAPWLERFGAVAILAGMLVAAKPLVHPSISNAGMGFLLYVLATPVLCLALVVWAWLSRRLTRGPRWAALIATATLACGAFMLIRTGGITGEGESDFHWRWTPSPEELLLADSGKLSPTPSAAPAGTTGAVAEWPGFRGPARDGTVRGTRIASDWQRSPPVELWRRPVGPGWSSFAVHGDRFYTQEQRGDDELVSCYSVSTGQPIWAHRDAARFWESNAGAGPRATPTLHSGQVFTLGATGIVNALNADDGKVVWSRDAAADTGAKLPGWGFAGSPLIVDDLVIVAASGRLAGYDRATGDSRWTIKTGGGGYSSPHLISIDGVAQVGLANGSGAIGLAPATGIQLWKYERSGDGIVQPGVAGSGELLFGSGSGVGNAESGIRRVSLVRNADGWNAEERWSSIALKPYFNDFVVHGGHAYGFDGALLACIDLADGRRKWKGGRFGHGQVILLADQELLLVLSEKGELAVVEATPNQFREVARIPAITGKTWNHPVLVRDVVLVRNDHEMAAYRLAPPAP